ncbi:MAG: hypothetical protein ABEJ81_06920 [Haloferacaceae archaeon]
MGIISPHIVHYGNRDRSSGGEEGETRYRCLGCREGFPSVHRVCPECRGHVRRVDPDG